MQAIILSIGDELALGQTVDTNSAWLSQRLARLGIPTRAHETVADDLPLITQAIQWAAYHADLVIISGGIGPTDDDLTRQAVADAMGRPLVENAKAIEHLQRFFEMRGRPMPDRNRVQALHPQGTAIIENPNGTAPGIYAQMHNAEVFVTPGVPREMKAMYENYIEPKLLSRGGARPVILTTKINTFGSGESNVAEQLGPLMSRDRNPKVGTTVSDGIVSVRVRSEFVDPYEAQNQLDDTLRQVHEVLGPVVFGQDEQTLAEVVVAELMKQKRSVATAESCTGGLIGAMLTEVPGSSQVYVGGWITYANQAKQDQLDVAASLLNLHGAVSREVVMAMAESARKKSAADLAIAVSGIAGPSGGTEDKPVGTVWIAIASANETHALRFNLPGGRMAVRDRAAKCALQMIRLQLLGESLDHLSWAVKPAMETSS